MMDDSYTLTLRALRLINYIQPRQVDELAELHLDTARDMLQRAVRLTRDVQHDAAVPVAR